MRHYYQKPDFYQSQYGTAYICEHPVYNSCTLYMIGQKGLAVIQQRFNYDSKYTYWTKIDPWLCDDIYLNLNFKPYFDTFADYGKSGLYPTVTIRQIMWALKMKPLPKEPWETSFDKKII